MIVKESISFKRGLDPKEALGIGLRELTKDPKIFLKELIRHLDNDKIKTETHFSYNSKDSYRYWIYWDLDSDPDAMDIINNDIKKIKKWVSKNTYGIITDLDPVDRTMVNQQTGEYAGDYYTIMTVQTPSPLKENIQFRRGLNPKKALGIGRKHLMQDLDFMVKTMTEEIKEIKEIKIQTSGDMIILILHYNKITNRPLYYGKMKTKIHNWIFDNSDIWRLNDFSDITTGDTYSDKDFWNVITLQRKHGRTN